MESVLVLGARPGPVLASRLARACEIPAQRYVVSGYGESGAMREWLEARGVASESIAEEPLATSTNENLERTRALFPAVERWIVVTSDFHVWRTRLWIWHLGFPGRVVGARSPRGRALKHWARELAAGPHTVLRICWRRLLHRLE